ncbi:MAG: glycosyltransferase family 4 protein [Bacteroidaceae bacterium]|nr:glycosyltransferase family 4 protein [Bacteroidaceae bacterium]
MKVLFIIHLPPPVHGAAVMGSYIRESSLINSTFECKYINLAIAKSVEDIGKGGIGKVWKTFRMIGKIVKTIRQWHPDLVYITPNARGGAYFKEWLIVMTIKAMGRKVIAHYHNKGVAQSQRKWYYDITYRLFFKNLKLILLAPQLYDDVKRYVRPEDIHYCPNGCPEQTSREHSGGAGLLFLSNLLPAKGVYVLLEALHILKERNVPFQCSFVGNESAEISAQVFQSEVCRLDLLQQVRYLGRKYGADKELCFQQADLFILPSLNECFPLVLLEAMQHSLPCISTRVGGIEGIIDHKKTGLLTEPDCPKSLADAIEYMIVHPQEADEMGRMGKEKFLCKFTLQHFEKNITSILKHEILHN